MPHDTEDMIQLLLNTNKEQEQTIVDLRATIKELRSTIANLNETIDELKRKIFGTSSEKTRRPDCKLCLNGMPVPLLRNGYSIFNGTKYR